MPAADDETEDGGEEGPGLHDEDYPDLETMLRGYMSAAPMVRAGRAAGDEAVRRALTEAVQPLETPDGRYQLPMSSGTSSRRRRSPAAGPPPQRPSSAAGAGPG